MVKALVERITNSAVVLDNVSLGYGSVMILSGVSLEVGPGEVVTILGESGCGKSTLIKTIVGLLRPDKGRVIVLGRDVFDDEAVSEEEVRRLRRRVGMLFQNGALLGSITVGDNVALPLREHTDLPEKVIRRIVAGKLALVGLDGTEALYPAELSGGMRKRAALARAIALDPELLVCDEPSSGLDPVVAAGLDHLLLKLREHFNMTIVAVTHDLASARILADRVVMVGNRGVLAEGTYEALESSNNLIVRRFFERRAKEE